MTLVQWLRVPDSAVEGCEPLNPLTLGQCALKVTAVIHHNSGLYWPWNLEG